MKRLFLTFISTLFIFNLSAQESSFDYGKITNNELSMSSFKEDSTASAVVISKNTNIRYESAGNHFCTVSEIRIKIKIFKKIAIDRGSVSIQYYNKSNNIKETINNIEAASYNKEGDKIIKSKLDKKYIFDEQINDYLKQVKFAIPNVKVGSNIE